MSAAGVVDQARGTPPNDLRHRLQTLRTRVTTFEPDAAMDQMMSNVCEAVERLGVEHVGMAQELLCVYEQLGAIFEVTRRLSTVQGESQVVELFVDSLRRSYNGRDVFVVPSVEVEKAVRRHPGARSPGAWLSEQVRQAPDRGRVQVVHPPVGHSEGNITEAMVGPVFAGQSFICAIILTRADDVEPFHASDMLLLESLTMFCGDLIRNHRLVRELREMSVAMVRSLVNAVDQKDAYTSGHSLRVGHYATLLGRALGMDDVDLQMLQWSALLHDVGKIGIRDAVLKKEGKLTDDEFNHVKEHPVRSHQVVQEVPQLKAALDGVLYHHERYNGTGYPAGLKGEDIPLQARIIQIADIFDALTSNRSYRPAYDWRQALDVLEKEEGQTVDPRLRRVFDRLIRAALENDPDGWNNLVRRANAFAQVGETLRRDVPPQD